MIERAVRGEDLPRSGGGSGIFRKSEFLFHILVCVMMMNAFFPFVRSRFGIHPDQLEGDPLQRTLLAAAYLLALLALCFHGRKVLVMVAATPAIWLLLLWATLSVVWSGFPDIAFRRVLAAWLTSLYGLVLVLRFELKQLLRLLGAALLVVIVGSLVLLVVFPEWGVMGPPLLGNWRGAFVHKNHLGRFSALALLVWGYLLAQSKKNIERILWGAALVIASITLIGARSLSALVIAAVMPLSVLFLKILSKWKKLAPLWLLLFLSVSGIAVSLFVENQESILAVGLNKNATLTGRIPLWQNLSQQVSQRPLLGYGYASFWLGTEGPSALIWKNLDWEVRHAHNGYLDLWLQLGLPGICLGVYLLLRMLALGIKNYFKTGLNGPFWPLFMIYFIGINMVESILLAANSLFWVLIVYGYCDLKSGRSQTGCQEPVAFHAPANGAAGVPGSAREPILSSK
jgi:exopolysaccharide production protein ExoQ